MGRPDPRSPKTLQQQKNPKTPKTPIPKVNVLSPKVNVLSPKVNVKYFREFLKIQFKVFEICCWGVTVTGV